MKTIRAIIAVDKKSLDISENLQYIHSMSSQIINIICQGERFMPLSDLTGLQGDLKTLHEAGYQKIKKLIDKEGFAFPVKMAFMKGKPYGVIGGHQIIKIVNRMISEGYEIRHNGQIVNYLPVSVTDCKSAKHAARLILCDSVNVGKITNKGWESFVEFNELDKEELRIDFQEFPDFQIPEITNFEPQEKVFQGNYYRDSEDVKHKEETRDIMILYPDEETKAMFQDFKEKRGIKNDTEAFKCSLLISVSS